MRICIIFMLAFFLTPSHSAFSQLQIVSLDPPQNALSVPKDANLNVTFNLPLDENTVLDTNIVVFAERTGTHFGTLMYDPANKTLTLDPDENFLAGERVTVTLANRIQGSSGERFRGFSWHFTVKTSATENFGFVFRGEWAAGQSTYFDATDLNNDGYPDLVAADFFTDKVFLYLNDQKGNFFFSKAILQDQGNILSMIQFGDFNKDGLTDVYVDSKYFFLINESNANFQTIKPEIFSQLLGGFSFIADYDNDGNSDIVISLFKRDSLWVYKGLGETDFQFQYHQPLPETGNPSNPVEGTFDLNNDGQIDLIAQLFAYSRDSLIVFLNNGDLTFNTDKIYDPIKRIIPGDQYTNDLDSDGDLDHAVFGAPRSDTSKFLMFNDGFGHFEFSDASLFKPKTSVYGGDIDADGDIDLVASWGKVISVFPRIEEAFISILTNEGNRDFELNREIQIAGGIIRVMFLDIDRDDDLDIVGLRYVSVGWNIFWMENTIGTEVQHESIDSAIREFELEQNYPNPFNASTTISYKIPHLTLITLTIYDTTGKEVKVLVSEINDAGTHQVQWHGLNNLNKEVSSGIYIVKMHAGRFQAQNKILLLR